MKVAAVLNFIWTLPAHRAAFHAIARARGAASREAAAADNVVGTGTVAEEEEDRFVSFANGIIGHTTGVLTEALKGLPVIRDTLRSMGQPEVWGALDEEERGRRTSQLDETTSLVKSSLLLAAQTTPLLAVLTEERTICQEFMRGELVGRLAAMLVKGVADLGGPRGLELKVDNPESYGFRPRALLKDLITATLNLAREPAFVEAVAQSGMWRAGEWDKVASVVERIALTVRVAR
jgi:ubiquitin conjugation factor E4 B